LPRYFMQGYSYNLPDYYAYDYKNNANPIKAQITATGGVLDGNKFTVSNNNEAIITYTATSATGQTVKHYLIKIVNVKNGNKLDISKFFKTDNSIAAADSDAVDFGAMEISKPSGFTFINQISTNDFSLMFSIDSSKNSFTKLNIYLTDCIDDSVFVKLGIVKATSKFASTKLYVNDIETSITFSESFYNDGIFTIKFNNRNQTLIAGDGKFVINKTASSAVFSGFSKGLAYLSMYTDTLAELSSFSLYRINGQIFKSGTTEDIVEPDVSLNGLYEVFAPISSNLIVLQAVISDVLGPCKEQNVTVTDPNGTVVSSIDGINLNKVSTDREYSIKLTLFGNYRIVYNAEDSNGNPRIYRYSIEVIDNIPPEITLNEAMPEVVKKGTVVSLPDAVISDNADNDITVYIFVAKPLSIKNSFITGNTFIASTEGVYRIRYMCIDKSGNMAMNEYKITCE